MVEKMSRCKLVEITRLIRVNVHSRELRLHVYEIEAIISFFAGSKVWIKARSS